MGQAERTVSGGGTEIDVVPGQNTAVYYNDMLSFALDAGNSRVARRLKKLISDAIGTKADGETPTPEPETVYTADMFESRIGTQHIETAAAHTARVLQRGIQETMGITGLEFQRSSSGQVISPDSPTVRTRVNDIAAMLGARRRRPVINDEGQLPYTQIYEYATSFSGITLVETIIRRPEQGKPILPPFQTGQKDHQDTISLSIRRGNPMPGFAASPTSGPVRRT